MSDVYLDPKDVVIARIDDSASLRLMDCDGNSLWIFPDTFSEEQIKTAVRFANHVYSRGLDAGADRAQWKMRTALGLD